ncbi:hypothetical protein F5B22DRAFT_650448 [Xylaria bambusicola]|uniref:uncharacterized protein n=1 Tax=Xylaria bambusicola TaxID=326684 RepID=UPI002007A6FA|nr:uncharacterized protein F5B22DRAFT_650448 [Xylaria bambusicola]KAI0506800.1 hypothetical protein F5B22DRAFT_650448 [Xylaria bambusicola]
MATKKSAVRGILPPTVNTTKSSSSTTKDTSSITEAKAEENESTPYSQALSRLEPLQPILLGIAHRNKNQHRRAAWWRHFGLLRRNCARLVEVLVEAVAVAQKNAAKAAKAAKAGKAKSKKRRREELASGNRTDGNADVDAATGVVTDENVVRHVTWIRDVLSPKCYLAFSQLIADTQFSPIGVVLLGILAQLQAACDIAVPPPSPSALATSAVTEFQPSIIDNTLTANNIASSAAERSSNQSESSAAPGENQGDGDEKGKGKTISREAVERAAAQQKRDKDSLSRKTEEKLATGKIKDIPRARSKMPLAESATLPSQEKQAQPDEDIPSRPAKKLKTATAATKAVEEKGPKDKKTSKKKAKKGDAFDDLFKGLM